MFESLISMVDGAGYLGIALMLLAENLFPPIPSEIILPLAGFIAAKGNLNPVGVVVAGSMGSMVGAWFWYFVAARFGIDRLKKYSARYGRWMTVCPDDIDHVCHWFKKHGKKAVFFGRFVPGIHSLISIPAGVAGMKLTPFLLYSTAGTLGWVIPYVWAGYVLKGDYSKVSDWMNPLSTTIIIAVIGFYIYRVVTFIKPRRKRKVVTG